MKTKNLDSFLLEQRENELSDNTINQYDYILKEFLTYIDNDFSKLKIINFKKYLKEEKKLSASSVNTWIVVINKYLKYINRKSLILKKERIQKEFSIKEALTVKDYKRLLRHAKRRNDHQSYYMMKILAMTGCRISELRYFTVENLNTFIEIKSKNKIREIAVVPELLRELRKYSREQRIKSGTLFPSFGKPSQMISPSGFWKRMQKIAGSARVKKKKVHAHAFRHLYATVFLKQFPGNTPQLRDLMGHSSIETTSIYTKLTRSSKIEMLEELDFNK